jgi:hypothetical protein
VLILARLGQPVFLQAGLHTTVEAGTGKQALWQTGQMNSGLPQQGQLSFFIGRRPYFTR